MIEISSDLTIIIIVGIIVIAPILLLSARFNDPYSKKRAKLMQEYIKDLEIEVDSWKKENRALTNSINARERGPRAEGDLSDLSSILPELIPQFSDYAPKWLKPLLSNKQVQESLATYIEKNPEQASNLIGRLIGKKNDNDKTNNDQGGGMSL